MSTNLKRTLVLTAALLAAGCSPGNPQTTDSQTNWLRSCHIDAECDGFDCLCGVCTTPCDTDSACAGLPGAACVPPEDSGSVAMCGGETRAASGMCLPRCEETGCANGQMCVAGVCAPEPKPDAQVEVDTSVHHQSLIGFGASIAYGEDQILAHPQHAALVQAIFADLGLDVLRLRNRYAHAGETDLSSAGALVAAATESLGHAPTVFLNSWSPPASLKLSGAAECHGNPATCTLVKDGDSFDYAGFADYWRASLDAYAAVGVVPDYLGIQNNPNWVPGSAETGEACRFLPSEGSTHVTINGADTMVHYPGFAEAQQAILTALQGRPSMPKIIAPDTSDFQSVADYLSALDMSQVDGLAHHFYGVDPQDVDTAALAALGELATQYDRPLLQTEMQADGFGTALLMHYALVIEGASAYLQAALTGPTTGPVANAQALIGIGANAFIRQGPYFALQHFALHTDPGWLRVDASSSAADLLVSAWSSPSDDALTVILINRGNETLTAALDPQHEFATSSVTRTVFGGLEHAAQLGALSAGGVLQVPGHAIVTVAFSN